MGKYAPSTSDHPGNTTIRMVQMAVNLSGCASIDLEFELRERRLMFLRLLLTGSVDPAAGV